MDFKMLIFSLFALALILVFVGGLSITFSPFSISFPHWRCALGMILLLSGLCFINNEYYRKGLKEGVEHGVKTSSKNYSSIIEGLIEDGSLDRTDAINAMTKFIDEHKNKEEHDR